MATLPLNDIVQVSLNVSPVSIVRTKFNLGLIVGKSTIISAATRVKTYASLAEMIADGWQGTEKEYLSAQTYFAQVPRPQRVAIGRWDGTGAETVVQAITACRAANSDWYGVMVSETSLAKADHTAIAAYIESATPYSTYFFTTADSDVLAGTAGNVFLTLQASAYRRTIGQYSATNNAVAAILGYAMGATTGLANSAYTLKFKKEVGITASAITSAQITAIKNANGNVYINRGSTYDMFENGVVSSGAAFDEIINLDIMTNSIQTYVMSLLQASPKVPQTEAGITSIVDAITRACEEAVSSGILAPGTWSAAPILNVSTGDYLTKGYLVLADTLANQSSVDRAARKSPPIYVLAKMAGSVETVVIAITVDR